jgi:hypothetical protein
MARPNREDRSDWIAVGGIVLGVGATGVFGWLTFAAPAHEPLWPAFAFVAVAAVGLYILLAPILRLWPWRPLPWHWRHSKRPAPDATDSTPITVAVPNIEYNLAQRRLSSAQFMVLNTANDEEGRVNALAAVQELQVLRDAGEAAHVLATPALVREWAELCEGWLAKRTSPAEAMRFRRIGADQSASDQLDAKLAYLTDELWPKLREGYWEPVDSA